MCLRSVGFWSATFYIWGQGECRLLGLGPHYLGFTSTRVLWSRGYQDFCSLNPREIAANLGTGSAHCSAADGFKNSSDVCQSSYAGSFIHLLRLSPVCQ